MYHNKFEELLERKQREHGSKFNAADLSKKFIPFYNTGGRIEVKTPCGTMERGRVGITTGRKPAFLLMHRTSDYGSSTVLSGDYEITRIISK